MLTFKTLTTDKFTLILTTTKPVYEKHVHTQATARQRRRLVFILSKYVIVVFHNNTYECRNVRVADHNNQCTLLRPLHCDNNYTDYDYYLILLFLLWLLLLFHSHPADPVKVQFDQIRLQLHHDEVLFIYVSFFIVFSPVRSGQYTYSSVVVVAENIHATCIINDNNNRRFMFTFYVNYSRLPVPLHVE